MPRCVGEIVPLQRQAVQRVRVGNDVQGAAQAGVPYADYVQLKALDGFADAALAGTPVALGAGAVAPTKAVR